ELAQWLVQKVFPDAYALMKPMRHPHPFQQRDKFISVLLRNSKIALYNLPQYPKTLDGSHIFEKLMISTAKHTSRLAFGEMHPSLACHCLKCANAQTVTSHAFDDETMKTLKGKAVVRRKVIEAYQAARDRQLAKDGLFVAGLRSFMPEDLEIKEAPAVLAVPDSRLADGNFSDDSYTGSLDFPYHSALKPASRS